VNKVDTRRLLLEVRRSLYVALPLIGAQLLQMGNGFVDALVAGRLGTTELAAGGIGAGMWFFASLMCIGVMAGLSPILSQLIGQRRRIAVGEVFRQGMWLGVITGLVALLFALAMVWSLPRWSVQAELVPHIRAYLMTACWSLPAFAVVMVCRNVCEATALTRPVLLVQFIGLLVNLLADLTFGLGWFGFPKLGLSGIGMATSFVMFTMAACLLWLLHRRKRFERFKLFAGFERPSWRAIKPMLSLSVPIYFGLLFEAGLFFVTGVQMGVIGTLQAAAHNIAIGIASACYMLPLGLSFALTARIGRVFGRESPAAIRLRVLSGLFITLMMAVTTASLLVLFRKWLPGLYTSDPELIRFAGHLLIFAAIFQLSDGLQVSLIGMLRGLQDTRVPMLINLVSYWVIAFGIGYYSAHHLGFGASGLWAGLIIGLTVATVALSVRLWWRIRQLEQSGGGGVRGN
jgi:MATE family multidrug resistance protein